MSTKVFHLIRVAPAAVLALSLATACSKHEKPAVNGDTAVTEPAPPPNVIPEPNVDQNGTSSATTSNMDLGTATATTDAMSGKEPQQETAATTTTTTKTTKSHRAHKMKAKKSTKTETTETKTPDVGAVSPIYDSTDTTTESGTTTSASIPVTNEISTPIMSDYSAAPGRMASALTDWGVVYRINDAQAASQP